MSLQFSVIAGAPVTTRADTKTVVGVLTDTVPPDPSYSVVDGVLTTVDQYPEREGQMIFYRNGSELFVTMYVAVIVDYVGDDQVLLDWKEVQNWGLITDPRTGLKKDPLLGFYSTLAS